MRRVVIALAAVLLVSAGLSPTAHAALPGENPTCGSMIDHSFRQTGPRTCTGSWITINAPDVVVEMDGNTVTSNETGTGIATLPQATGATIRSGELVDFDVGILTVFTQQTRVEGVRVRSSNEAFQTGPKSTLRGNIALSNTKAFRSLGEKSVLIDNLAASNEEDGFEFGNSFSGLVEGNVAFRNGSDGFRPTTAKTTYSHNVALGNTEHGFNFVGGAAKVLQNIAVDNGGDGFSVVSSASGFTFTENVANRNGFLGGVDDNLGRGFDFHSTPAPKAKGNIAARNDDTSECSPASICAPPGPILNIQSPSCGSTIFSSFQLGMDQTCSGSNGYTIGADKVTIDLGGHRLSLTGGGSYLGINTNHHSGVTIRNGAIRGFGHGVRFWSDTSKALVEGVVLESNTVGVVQSGSGNTIRGNVTSLGAFGFDSDSDSGKWIATRNAVLSPTSMGFTVAGCCATLDTNIVGPDASKTTGTLGSGDLGFRVESAAKVLLTRNVAMDGFSHGFKLEDLPVKIVGNEAFENGGDGFNIDSTLSGWALTDNVAIRNGFQSGGTDGFGLGFELNSIPPPKAKGNIATLNDNPANCSSQMTC